jgi:hypothetical protein
LHVLEIWIFCCWGARTEETTSSRLKPSDNLCTQYKSAKSCRVVENLKIFELFSQLLEKNQILHHNIAIVAEI